jgi:hypothetical protein
MMKSVLANGTEFGRPFAQTGPGETAGAEAEQRLHELEARPRPGPRTGSSQMATRRCTWLNSAWAT